VNTSSDIATPKSTGATPRTPEEPTSKKVVRNTLFNYLAVLSLTLLRFLALPVIVHGLGNDRYGVYAAVMGVAGYVGLLDLGIGVSLTTFVAEYHARREVERLNRLLGTALLLYAGLGLLGMCLMAGFADLMIRSLFHIPRLLWPEAHIVFWLSAFSLFNGLTLGVFGNLLNGLQRQDVSRSITVANTLVTYGGGILLIKLGYGLVAFVLLGTAANLAGFLAQAWFARRLLPGVHLLPRGFDRREARRIARFSLAMFVNQIAARNMLSLDRLVLAAFLPIGNVTLYTVGAMAAGFCTRLPAAAVLASLPAAAELAARGRSSALHDLVLRGIKYTGIAAIPVFTAAGILAPDLIGLWMGPGYESSARVLQLLLVGSFWLVITASGQSVMVGIGKPYLNTFYALLQIVLGSALMVVLVRSHGLLGAALSSLATYSLGGCAYLFHSTLLFGIPLRRLLNARVLFHVLSLLAPGILWVVVRTLRPSGGPATTLLELVLYLALYAVLLIRYHIDDFDIEKMAQVLPAVRRLDFLRRTGPSPAAPPGEH